MSPETIGFIGVAVLLVLIFMRVWVGLAMAVVGFLGYACLDGWNKALSMIGYEPFTQGANYVLSAVPLFILMGVVVANTGIGEDLYNTARKWLGQLQGGLAMASVAACGAFAAMSGSSMATAVTMGRVAYPEMIKHKYDTKLAAGCISAGGTIGILIPPSIGFILYGLLTETSIGKLFIAGIIPGILEVAFYIITIYIICGFNPRLGPPGPRTGFREKIIALKGSWPMLVIFLLVIGGIYGGIFTATEAGAIGAFGAIIVSFVLRRLKWANLRSSMTETAQSAAMIVFMIAGAYIFMRFLTISKMPFMLSEFVAGLNASPYFIIFCIVVFYIIIGCFLDIMAAMVLTVPIIFPTIISLGLNPIWFGVIMVRLMEVGQITPPMGLNIFALARVVNIPIKSLYRGVIPFVLADFAHIALLLAVPKLSLFLVELM